MRQSLPNPATSFPAVRSARTIECGSLFCAWFDSIAADSDTVPVNDLQGKNLKLQLQEDRSTSQRATKFGSIAPPRTPNMNASYINSCPAEALGFIPCHRYRFVSADQFLLDYVKERSIEISRRPFVSRNKNFVP
jgi:hypothetical protein